MRPEAWFIQWGLFCSGKSILVRPFRAPIEMWPSRNNRSSIAVTILSFDGNLKSKLCWVLYGSGNCAYFFVPRAVGRRDRASSCHTGDEIDEDHGFGRGLLGLAHTRLDQVGG
jgi:hypothetical protein